MATVEECRAALQKLAAKLAANAAEAREKLDFDRSLACRVTDLDPSEGVDATLARVDQAMREAKITGRGRWVRYRS